MKRTSPFRSVARLRSNEPGEDTIVLVVSENPELIHFAQTQLTDQIRVIGCTGPVQSPCNLETRRFCPLARHASVALVDSPASGLFHSHWKVVSAGDYAEELQRAHPGCTVVLCGAPESCAGPTGEVTTAADALSALRLIGEIVELSMSHNTLKGEGHEGQRSRPAQHHHGPRR